MDTSLILMNLLLGGLLGILGQGIRVIAGLKKLHDTTQEPLKHNEQFDPRRLWISLFLGFIAGGLGVVTLMDDMGAVALTKDMIITMIGIGYAGVDFIEAFLSKYITSEPPATIQPSISPNSSSVGLSVWTSPNTTGVQNLMLDADELPAAPRSRP